MPVVGDNHWPKIWWWWHQKHNKVYNMHHPNDCLRSLDNFITNNPTSTINGEIPIFYILFSLISFITKYGSKMRCYIELIVTVKKGISFLWIGFRERERGMVEIQYKRQEARSCSGLTNTIKIQGEKLIWISQKFDKIKNKKFKEIILIQSSCQLVYLPIF
jgi:hypothetical protein